MLPASIHKQTYIIITIIVSIPLLIWAYIHATQTHARMLRDIKQELLLAVTELEQRLPLAYEQILAKENVLDGTDEEKRAALNKHLQPILEDVVKQYPRFGFGYYSPDLNIVAVVPFAPEMLGQKAPSEALKVYQTHKTEVITVDSGPTREGAPLLGVVYPLFNDGKMFGHACVNYRTEDLYNEFYFILLRNLSLIAFLWISVSAFIFWSFKRIGKSLLEFTRQIETGRYNPDKLQELPQLIPVLNTVVRLNNEKAAVMEEIARLDRLNLVSQMAAGVAHEIRNPLTVIKGFLQFFQQKEVAATTKEHCRLVLEELSRIESIITDFLSLAKNRVTEQKRCHINSILRGMEPLLAAEALKQSIELKLDLDERIPETLLSDKEIIQLVLNLSRNAMEAMGKGGRLTFQTQLVDDSFLLTISDTGCGIPEEIRKEMFNPFYTTKEAGTGLGLAICASIVNRHGGTITVDSVENEGTTFMIIIPIMA